MESVILYSEKKCVDVKAKVEKHSFTTCYDISFPRKGELLYKSKLLSHMWPLMRHISAGMEGLRPFT